MAGGVRAQAAAGPPLRLRQDLALYPGERQAGGAATWVLHDPAANRFFRLTWVERELLALVDGRTAKALPAAARAQLGSGIAPATVEAFLRFLQENNLLVPSGPDALARLRQAAAQRRRARLRLPIRNHLFLRIPLLRPDRFLDRTVGLVGWLFRPATLWVLIAVAILGLVLVGRAFDSFLTSLPQTMTPRHWIAFGLGLAVAKILHEFGHAYAAKRYGCRVYSMGMVLIVLWPVLYTDTTDAWKLASRKARLVIGAAGIMVELGLAAICLLLWTVAPEGPWRSVLFLLSSTTWVLSLLVNLNPFMRFDGYYLLSDAVGMPNLQPRSFALGRWWLREWLFGPGAPPPEPPRRWMIAFAVATWLYRFVLLLTIALLVYHFVFKALGVVLLAWHLTVFLGQPIWRELRTWHKLMRETGLTWRMARMALSLALLVAALAYPWGGRIGAPAVLAPARVQQVYTPVDGRLARLHVSHGDRVAAGDTLATLAAPDLDHRIAQLQREVTILARSQEAASLRQDMLRDLQVIDADLGAALLELRQLRRQQDRSRLRAEHAGVVTNLLPQLDEGDWLGADTRLLSVVDPTSWEALAYVAEADVQRIAVGQTARFFPATGALPLPMAVIEVAPVAAETIRHPELTGLHGGPIAVNPTERGRLVPAQAVYRVRLRPAAMQARVTPARPGRVTIAAEPQSLLAAAARRVLGVLRREFGG